MTYINKIHESQNKYWHKIYSNDLEKDEIVPFNATRDDLGRYWWIPNHTHGGESLWRSKKQREEQEKHWNTNDFGHEYHLMMNNCSSKR